MVFAIGSIGMAQYTLTGYDASAHMSEETHAASRSAATGILWSVVVSVIAGFILLVAITFAIPNKTEVQTQFTYITTYIWETSMSRHWAETLLFIVVAAQFYCLTACVTSGSRMLFAFSRDRAVPGHQAWRKVSRHRVPVLLGRGRGGRSRFLLMLPTWWNNLAGYYVGTSVGTTGLYIAFILPVILRYRQGASFEKGAWSLGKHYKWINPIAIVWVVLISIVFMLPTSPGGIPGHSSPRFDWNLANYAPLTIGSRVLAVRRLVGALRQQVVQGPGAHGHRGRARAARGRSRRASSSCLPPTSADAATVRPEGRRQRRPSVTCTCWLESRHAALPLRRLSTSSPTCRWPGTSSRSSPTRATSTS